MINIAQTRLLACVLSHSQRATGPDILHDLDHSACNYCGQNAVLRPQWLEIVEEKGGVGRAARAAKGA
jgi:hypothetical protein